MIIKSKNTNLARVIVQRREIREQRRNSLNASRRTVITLNPILDRPITMA